MAKEEGPWEIRHNAYMRLDGAISTIIPPVERLSKLGDYELLGYADVLRGHMEQLMFEWTSRQMREAGQDA